MSAIFGIWRLDGAEVSSADLEGMGAVMAARSPDGRRTAIDGAVGLGHGLMRVNAEDAFEAQPLRDPESGAVLVADLRLDNREDLAAELGLDLAGLSDSAVLLAAWRRWGADCAEHLIGDFAFAVWEPKARRLTLSRDHFGQRYVHYHRGEGVFAFATEARALWRLAEVPRALDEGALRRFLNLDFSGDLRGTFFEGVEGVPGGSTVTVEADGRVSTRTYWVPHAAPEHLGRDEAYYTRTYRKVLAEAVACRTRRLTTPPGVMLSGGFDSSAIAGLCAPARVIAASAALPKGFESRHDARPGAEACARHMQHVDLKFLERGEEGLFTRAEDIYLASDGPLGAMGYIIDALHRDIAARGARMVMDGIGGDATLNPRGSSFLAWLLATGRLGRFISELAWRLRSGERPLIDVLRGEVIGPFRRSRASYESFAPSGAYVPHRRKVSEREDRLARLAMLQRRPRQPGSAEAAAVGLDLTRPMFDKRVIEFGLAIPETLSVVKGRNRYLARRALADVLPPGFQTRRRSQERLDPDFRTMALAALPRMREELERMQGKPALARQVDMEKVRRALEPEAVEAMDDAQLTLAARAFAIARYIAWFRRENL